MLISASHRDGASRDVTSVTLKVTPADWITRASSSRRTAARGPRVARARSTGLGVPRCPIDGHLLIRRARSTLSDVTSRDAEGARDVTERVTATAPTNCAARNQSRM